MKTFWCGWDDNRWDRTSPLIPIESYDEGSAAASFAYSQNKKVSNGEDVKVFVSPTQYSSDGRFISLTASVIYYRN